MRPGNTIGHGDGPKIGFLDRHSTLFGRHVHRDTRLDAGQARRLSRVSSPCIVRRRRPGVGPGDSSFHRAHRGVHVRRLERRPASYKPSEPLWAKQGGRHMAGVILQRPVGHVGRATRHKTWHPLWAKQGKLCRVIHDRRVFLKRHFGHVGCATRHKTSQTFRTEHWK